LAATWFPAQGEARGAVLLAHPWIKAGRSYFHRQGRLEALRTAGFDALTVDLGGLGLSTPCMGFSDTEVADTLAALRDRAPGLPLYLWGVSNGGYWSHLVLSRTAEVEVEIEAAMFEDVAPHLIEWSWRMTPWARPALLVFRYGLPSTYRYLNIRAHVPYFKTQRLAYVGGGRDRGVPAEDTRDLARRAGGECLVVPKSGHLSSIKRANAEVVGLALKTFGAMD
jgi:pimeloyl-ACP methyl ester carboxylesterase